jgi:hypothetical protein
MSEDFASKSFRWVFGLPLCLLLALLNLAGFVFCIVCLPLGIYYSSEIGVFLDRPARLGEVLGFLLFAFYVVIYCSSPWSLWERFWIYLGHVGSGSWGLTKSKGGPDFFERE